MVVEYSPDETYTIIVLKFSSHVEMREPIHSVFKSRATSQSEVGRSAIIGEFEQSLVLLPCFQWIEKPALDTMLFAQINTVLCFLCTNENASFAPKTKKPQ